jgi:hypothetical protein
MTGCLFSFSLKQKRGEDNEENPIDLEKDTSENSDGNQVTEEGEENKESSSGEEEQSEKDSEEKNEEEEPKEVIEKRVEIKEKRNKSQPVSKSSKDKEAHKSKEVKTVLNTSLSPQSVTVKKSAQIASKNSRSGGKRTNTSTKKK